MYLLNNMRINRSPNGYSLRLLGALMAITLPMCFCSSCTTDDPKKEDTPELITRAIFTFTPTGGGQPIVATATDPDGEGVQNIGIDGPIHLSLNTTYTLGIQLINELADPADPAYNITSEVEAEGDEHMLFFSWTNDTFSEPAGDGNVDHRDDFVNYSGGPNSKDANDRPLGLTTTWTAASIATTGTFRVLLKHQPDLKSDTSDSSIGETDLDITFPLEIQ